MRLVCLSLLISCVVAFGAVHAKRVPTPEAFSFSITRDTTTELVYGFVLPLQDERVGAVARCDRTAGALRAGLYFGFFPSGVPVQAAVRLADGTVERFGPVLRTGPDSGFHAPAFTDPSTVLRLLHAVFSEGALVSNGHNSFWNRIPAAAGAEARDELLACQASGRR